MRKIKTGLLAVALAATFTISTLPTFVAPVLVGTAVTALVLSQTSCDKATLLQNAQTVVGALKEVVPIFTANGIGIARINTAISTGERLIAAFSADDTSNALSLTSSLIKEFNSLIAEDIVRIANPATRTIVLVGLAVGNIALHHIADALQAEAIKVKMGSHLPDAASNMSTIRAFSKKKNWRCRSSQTGQFNEMSFCKKHPDVSVVETY